MDNEIGGRCKVARLTCTKDEEQREYNHNVVLDFYTINSVLMFTWWGNDNFDPFVYSSSHS